MYYTFKQNNKNIEKSKIESEKKEVMNNISSAIFTLYELKLAIHNNNIYLIKSKQNPIFNLMPNEYSTKIYFSEEKVVYYIDNILNFYGSKYTEALLIHLENLNTGIYTYFEDYNCDVINNTSKINEKYLAEVMDDINIFIYDLKTIKYKKIRRFLWLELEAPVEKKHESYILIRTVLSNL